MTVGDLISALASWKLLLLALLVFGIAPGFVLRLVVLAFHPEDPRRAELRGELGSVPRWERPLWVAEQLEVAIVEGLGERLEWALTGRVIYRWHLRSGTDAHRANPDTFWIPDEDEKAVVPPGAHVQLIFAMRDGWTERMWVEVEKAGRRRLVGSLLNQPVGIPRLDPDQRIRFSRDDIIDITFGDDDDALDNSDADECGVQTSHAGCHGPHREISER